MYIAKQKHRGRPASAAVVVLMLATLAACTSTPEAPTLALAEARNAIANAEQSDARQYAGAELDQATQKIEQAERATAQENMILAEQLAQQARVMATLATARTDAAKAEQINSQLRQDAEALDQEMQRLGDQQ